MLMSEEKSLWNISGNRGKKKLNSKIGVHKILIEHSTNIYKKC